MLVRSKKTQPTREETATIVKIKIDVISLVIENVESLSASRHL